MSQPRGFLFRACLGDPLQVSARNAVSVRTIQHYLRRSPSVHSIIQSPVQIHSRKPHIVREKIVDLVGDLPRIELFAREKVDGWLAWGNALTPPESPALDRDNMPKTKSNPDAAGSEGTPATPREIFTVTITLGKRQHNRLVEIGKPFGMSAEEAAQLILTKNLGKD